MNAKTDKIESSADNELRSRFKRLLPYVAPYFGLVFVVILFGLLTGGQLLTARNLKMVINQFFPTLLCCIGAVFYWAHGALDISIGSAMGCAAILAGNLLNQGHVVGALLGAIAVAMMFGLVNGVLSTYCGLPAFLASLCTMFIGNGIQSYFTLKEIIYIDTAVVDCNAIDNTVVKLLVSVIAIVICYILFEYTFIGKNNIIIGGNIKAAKFSGIKVNRDRIIAFLIAGVLVGVAAFFNTVRVKSVTSTFGSGIQFNVMVSMVFGGMLIGGGKNSRISSGVIGAITYTLVANGLQLAGLPSAWVNLIKGIIFLAVMAMTFMKKGKGGLLPN